MSETLRVLQIEDSESDAAMVVRLLEKAGYEVTSQRVEDAESMTAALTSGAWDAVIAGYHVPQFGAPASLSVLQGTGLDLPFIVVSGTIGEDAAVAMMKAGAHDYLTQGDLARLAPAVEREIREAKVRQERRQAREQLRINEQRYHSLFEHMRNGFAYCRMLYDDQNRAIDFISLKVNPAFEQLTGLRDVVGKRVSEVVPGIRESMPEFFEIQGRVAWTGRSESFEVEFHHIARWLSVSVYSPEQGYFVALFDDITERKRTEADRETTMGLLRLLNSPSGEPELISGAVDLLREWSGCDTLGIRLQDGDAFPYRDALGLSRPCLTEMTAAERDAAPECICAGILTARSDSADPGFTPQGSFWINSAQNHPEPSDPSAPQTPACRCVLALGLASIALVPLRFSGRTIGLLQMGYRQPGRFTPTRIALLERLAANLAIAIEQRRTQAALRASEERYRLISENTADVIWLVDVGSSHYTYISPSVENLLGYLPEELLSKDLYFTLRPEAIEYANRRMAESLAAFAVDPSARTWIHNVDQMRKDGSTVSTEVVITLLPNGAGGVGELLGVTRNITERVKMEARLMQAQKMESVGRLAGGVAHDFNNLLTVINGYSQLLLVELRPDDPARVEIQEIKTAGERAAALTQQLLAFSRKQSLQPRVLDLNSVVSGMRPMLARLLGEDVDLHVELHPEPALIYADQHQLEQVVMNLAVNSRDAMPGGGRLSIRTEFDDPGRIDTHPGARAGRSVSLVVADSGSGMSEETRRHIFEPFFTTKAAGKGTGLGLAMVQGIVEQSGGSIEVASELGCGTSFRVCLPQVDEPLTEAPTPEVNRLLRGSETVLVVEDNAAVRGFTVAALAAYGYRVIQAENGHHALALCEEMRHRIDLVLTDVVMPLLSGSELASRLKAKWPDIKVLFMSGYTGDTILDHGVRAEEPQLIQKPFTPDRLAARIRDMMATPGWPCAF